MTNPSGAGRGERLDSWKEIAVNLERGARTVQPWEREAGLPEHRLQHDRLGTVYASCSELDRWWADHRAQETPAPEASVAVLPFADLSRDRASWRTWSSGRSS